MLEFRPDCDGGTAGALMKGSLCIEPGILQPANPEPISNPFVAGMLNMACASVASNLSKQGSPNPTGTFRMTHVTVPPMLSCLSLKSPTSFSIRSAASRFGHLTGTNASTVSRSMTSSILRNSGLVEGDGWSALGGKRNSSPIEFTKATISTPAISLRTFSAIAPAATRPGI
jgi:hypothetical protein